MHIAWPMMGIKNLTALRNSAEQRVVAPGPFLLIVIPDGRPLGVTPAGDHRAIEVQGDPCQPLMFKTLQDEGAIQLLKVGDAARISPTEHPTHRADMRQPAQPQGSSDQRVLSVAINIAQSPIAQHQVKDHQQGDAVKPYDGALLPMGEASLQLSRDIHVIEKGM
jgi:hypothetical protein